MASDSLQPSAGSVALALEAPPRVKFRVRFRKAGDLRLVSHHDLMHIFERAFRRADLPVPTTQGFNPRPKMWFALSLALGVAGLHEVLELELSQPLTAEDVERRLAAHAPPGIEILSVRAIDVRASAHVLRTWYRLPFPVGSACRAEPAPCGDGIHPSRGAGSARQAEPTPCGDGIHPSRGAGSARQAEPTPCGDGIHPSRGAGSARQAEPTPCGDGIHPSRGAGSACRAEPTPCGDGIHPSRGAGSAWQAEPTPCGDGIHPSRGAGSARQAEPTFGANLCDAFMSRTECWVERTRPRRRRINLRPFVSEMRVREDGLEFALWISPKGAARPEEIIAAVGLTALLDDGAVLERTDLEIIDELPPGADLRAPALETAFEETHSDDRDLPAESFDSVRPTAIIGDALAFDS